MQPRSQRGNYVSTIASLRCPRCGTESDAGAELYRGCPACRADGVNVNLVCEVPLESVARALEESKRSSVRGMWRYGAALPVDAAHAVSLGEGGTPLLELPALGAAFGLDRLYGKNEAANPVWSHKDRLASVAITAAKQFGARVVTGASTGNHGAALAAYSTRGGLRCVIATRADVPTTMKTLMQSYGAVVVATETSAQRYEIICAGIDEFGWYPASNTGQPPVGSSPYGVDAYKTIAYELYEELGGVPDWVAVPVAHGDCIAGIWRGFAELRELGLIAQAPRLVGAELFGAAEQALAGGPLGPVETTPTTAFSIGGAFTTYQSVSAIRDSDGVSCTVSEDELVEAQRQLAATEGLFGEAASAVPLAAVRKLRAAGVIDAGDRVVALLTSSGLKDPAPVSASLPAVPVIEPTLDALRAVVGDPAIQSELFSR
jgi:threonine synthase